VPEGGKTACQLLTRKLLLADFDHMGATHNEYLLVLLVEQNMVQTDAAGLAAVLFSRHLGTHKAGPS